MGAFRNGLGGVSLGALPTLSAPFPHKELRLHLALHFTERSLKLPAPLHGRFRAGAIRGCISAPFCVQETLHAVHL